MRSHTAASILGLAPILFATVARADEGSAVTHHALGGSVGRHGEVVREEDGATAPSPS